VAYPGIFFGWGGASGGGLGAGGWGGGVQQIQLRTENGDLGAVAPYLLVEGSGGSCNLVQEISFHIVKFS